MYDHAQSPRLGQRTAVENPGVQLVSLATLPEIAYRGQIVYCIDIDEFRVFDGSAWQIPTAAAAGGSQTFVGDTPPVADDIGDTWLNTNDYQLYVWNGTDWTPTTPMLDQTYVKVAIALVNGLQAWGTHNAQALITYNTVPPSSGVVENDFWCNPSTNQAFQYTSGSWVRLSNPYTEATIVAAGLDRYTLDGTISVFFDSSAPLGLSLIDLGDIWCDPTSSSIIRGWSGALWVDLQVDTAQIVPGSVTDEILHPDVSTELHDATSGLTDTNIRIDDAVTDYLDRIAAEALARSGADTANSNAITAAVNDFNNGLATKSQHTLSTAVPGTTANNAGDVWEQYVVNGTTGFKDVIGRWRGTGGTGWEKMNLSATYIPQLDIGTGTFGDLTGTRLVARSIGVDKLIVSDFTNYFPDRYFNLDTTATYFTDYAGVDTTTPPAGGRALKFSARDILAGGVQIAARPGDQFVVSATYRYIAGAATFEPSVWMKKADRTTNTTVLQSWDVTRTLLTDVDLGGGWHRKTMVTALKTGATDCAFVVPYLWINQNTPYTTTVSVSDITIQRRGGGELIVDGSIKAVKLDVNDLNAQGTITVGQGQVTGLTGALAGKETAGAAAALQTLWGAPSDTTKIFGGNILTRSIAADRLLISDFTNYVRDGDMANLGSWTATAGAFGTGINYVVTSSGADNVPDNVIRFLPTGAALEIREPAFNVTPGDSYNFSAWFRRTGTVPTAGTCYLSLYFYDKDGTSLGSATGNVLTFNAADIPGSPGGYFSGNITVPGGAVTGVVSVRLSSTVTSGAQIDLDRVRLRRKAGGELIVDGSITTNHLLTGAVTADKIQAGAITTKQLSLSSPSNLFADLSNDQERAQYPAASSWEFNLNLAGTPEDKYRIKFPGSTGSVNYNATYFGPLAAVKPGDVISYSFDVYRAGANYGTHVGFDGLSADRGTYVSYDVGVSMPTSVPSSVWTTYSGTFTVPANIYWLNPRFKVAFSGGGITGDWYYRNVVFRGAPGAIQTAASGQRVVIRNDGSGGIIEAFSGVASETAPAKFDPANDSGFPTLRISSGTTSTYVLNPFIKFQSGTSGFGPPRLTFGADPTDASYQAVLSYHGLDLVSLGITANGNVAMANYIKTGSTSSGALVAGTDKTVRVNFGTAFPDASYQVVFGLNEPSSGGTNNTRASVTNKNPGYFDMIFYRAGGTAALTVGWAAIRTTAG